MAKNAGVTTRHRHDCHCVAYGRPVDGTLEPARGGGRTTNHYAAPSKPLLYEHRTHHDASTGGGFARTGVSSVALLVMPPHVGK
jgi:hypothetical protein